MPGDESNMTNTLSHLCQRGARRGPHPGHDGGGQAAQGGHQQEEQCDSHPEPGHGHPQGEPHQGLYIQVGWTHCHCHYIMCVKMKRLS